MLPGMVGSDSDVVAELLRPGASAGADVRPSGDGGPRAGAAMRAVLPRLEGAFSFVLMDATHLYRRA